MPGPDETRLNLIDGVEYITLRADDFRDLARVQSEVKRLTHLHNLDHSLADQREAEVERLQRENGALSRMYALCEDKLRERTAIVNIAHAYINTPIDDPESGALYRALAAALRLPEPAREIC